MMSELRPTTGGALAVEEATCLWRHPARNVTLQVQRDALDHLSARAIAGLEQAPPREVGGLLFGQLGADATEPSVTIERVRFIGSEREAFNQSDAEVRQLIALVRALSDDERRSLVGYVRSDLREGLQLSEHDAAFIRASLPDRRCCHLVVKPFPFGLCMGAVFGWDGERLETAETAFEVPMLTRENETPAPLESDLVLAPTPAPAPEPVSPPPAPAAGPEAAAPQPLPRPSSPLPVPAAPSNANPARAMRREPATPASTRRPLSLSRLTAAAVLGITGLAGAGAYRLLPVLRDRLQFAPEAKTHIALQVARAGQGQLNLSWSRTAAEIRQAQDARLLITDGALHRELALDKTQLRSGTLAYFPATDDVQFRLEVNLDGEHFVAESVRAVLPGAAPTQPALPVALPLERPGRSAQPPNVSAALAAGILDHIRPEADRVVPPRHRLANLSPRVIDRVTPANLPPPPNLDLHLTDSSPLLFATSFSQGGPPEFTPRHTPSEVNLADVAQLRHRASALPLGQLAPSPATQPAATQAPATRPAPTPANYREPVPIRKVMPDLRALGVPLVARGVAVEVELQIDRNGKVSEARCVDPRTRGGLVAAAAISAARQWTFRPAIVNGHQVASVHHLIFRFQPRTQ